MKNNNNVKDLLKPLTESEIETASNHLVAVDSILQMRTDNEPTRDSLKYTQLAWKALNNDLIHRPEGGSSSTLENRKSPDHGNMYTFANLTKWVLLVAIIITMIYASQALALFEFMGRTPDEKYNELVETTDVMEESHKLKLDTLVESQKKEFNGQLVRELKGRKDLAIHKGKNAFDSVNMDEVLRLKILINNIDLTIQGIEFEYHDRDYTPRQIRSDF